MIKVSPSILSADFVNLERDIRALSPAGADYVHVDVMDGLFVPNITIGIPVVAAIRKITDLPLDVHLMIDRPHRYIEQFAAVSDWLGFHYEAGSDNAALLRKIRELGCKSCITIKPCTAPQAVFELLELCDMVLVMSVEPGFGGQRFMPEALEKLRALRAEITRRGLSVELEVDGGINAETAPQAAAAGATVLVAGNYIFSAEDMAARVAEIRTLA